MNKIALITDLHLGIKKSNDLFLDSQLAFINKQFEPYLRKNKIKEIFILGDIFDNRVSLNIKIKNAALDIFSKVLKDYKITALVGNHDTYLTSSIAINSLRFLDHLPNMKIIDKNTMIELYGKSIFLAPWIVNEKEFLAEIDDISADLTFGHYEINGFKLNKVKIVDVGFAHENMDRFTKVFSGHLHIRGIRKYHDNEIVYVGSPYQLNRGDAGEARGFCILNMDDLSYEFIDNEYSIQFVNLTYPEKFTKEMIKGNVIDVNVKFDDTVDDMKLQLYMKMIEGFHPAQTPQIIPINSFMSDVQTSGTFEVKSANDLMQEYINALTVDNKDKIYEKLESLYEEAKNEL